MKTPESTLTSFLRKYSFQIKPIKLDKAQIHALGSNARRLYGYSLDDVFKISFCMDTEVGMKIKKRMFGNVGIYANPFIRRETEWKETFSKIFAGFGLRTNYKIGSYLVDFFVEKLMLCLECDENNHRSYNAQEEEEREKFITEMYPLVRFNSKIDMETLFNGILKAKTKEVVKLYL